MNHDLREDKVRSGTSIREVLVRLWPYFMRRKLAFFSSIAAVAVGAIAGRLAVFVFGKVIDSGVSLSDRNMILLATLGYAILLVTSALMDYVQAYVFATLGNAVLFELRSNLVSHVQHLPISFFDKTPSGRIVTRLTNDVVALGEVFTQGLISVFAAVVSMVAIIVAMFAISPKLTLMTLAVAPPLVFVIWRLSQKVFSSLRASKAKLAAINAFVAENVGGMRVLQLYGRITKNQTRFRHLSNDYRSDMMNQVTAYALVWPTVSLFNGTSVAIALYFGGKMVMGHSVSTGMMVAFFMNVRAFIDPLNMILDKAQTLQNSVSGAERVFTLQDEVTEEEPLASLADVTPGERLRGEIEFRDVSFRYREGLPNALEKISFRIEPGQSVALVGRTGSGKSTIISLMQRLYDVSGGEVFIDGRPLALYPRKLVRSRIGVVQQDTFMFRGSVSDNIGLGDPRLTPERRLRAAAGARLSEFLRSHAGGLEARVEERGANLSFGERQLIAFARILAFDPDVLILDEATANIDSHTEQLIQEATRQVRKGRTSLIIAHRISTIVDCDKIIVLDKGRIAEEGSHAELYSRGGLYRQLCDAQFSEGQAIDEVRL